MSTRIFARTYPTAGHIRRRPGRWTRPMLAVLAATVLTTTAPSMASAGAVVGEGITTRASVSSAGGQATSFSSDAAISANGRYVAFASEAGNLVPGDTNSQRDVFVHDRKTLTTTRVSVSSNGEQGDRGSDHPAVSANGRHVAFTSDATNLVPGDTNSRRDVFLHDRTTGTTTRLSVSSVGAQTDGDSQQPAISTDGRYVTFQSNATNLVPGGIVGVTGVFVHDRLAELTTRVSVRSDGTPAANDSIGASISDDGRYVAFQSTASNLVDGDTNGAADVFLHDRTARTTVRVSVADNGSQAEGGSGNPTISGDGRHVAFVSVAGNLVPGDGNGAPDVFVRDVGTGRTTRVSVANTASEANQASSAPRLSATGRYVAFESLASNLVSGDTNGVSDVFLHDRQQRATVRVSIGSTGVQGNGGSDQPAISGDGKTIAFTSTASNLVPADGNGTDDVFVRQFVTTPPPTVPPTEPPTTEPPTTEPPTTEPPAKPSLSFRDTVGHTFEKDVAALAAAGITRGCNPPTNDHFCPDNSITRGQMAAFLTRALDLPAATTDTFADDNTSIFEKDIQALAAAGITRGCNPPTNDHFCPDDPVTRGQMAAFLNRALDLEPGTAGFTDTTGNVFDNDIQALAAAGITRGCNPPANNQFCPDTPVTRGQMAAFLVRGVLAPR